MFRCRLAPGPAGAAAGCAGSSAGPAVASPPLSVLAGRPRCDLGRLALLPLPAVAGAPAGLLAVRRSLCAGLRRAPVAVMRLCALPQAHAFVQLRTAGIGSRWAESTPTASRRLPGATSGACGCWLPLAVLGLPSAVGATRIGQDHRDRIISAEVRLGPDLYDFVTSRRMYHAPAQKEQRQQDEPKAQALRWMRELNPCIPHWPILSYISMTSPGTRCRLPDSPRNSGVYCTGHSAAETTR